MSKGKVTGLGGIFFKCTDIEKQRAWYTQHLGIETQSWGGGIFKWHTLEDKETVATTTWGPFKADTEYFNPSNKEYMFNYRVDDLDALLAKLKAAGVEIVGEVEEYEYGKFGWIMDPEGNKIELWEPIDGIF
ncbi:MAG: VOC family protein [Saprospiraceae bacterium]|nr:VOC family protein [Saprospiraceae bacterium]